MDISFYSAFLIGLAGSIHCVAMCGGVVAGLQHAIPDNHSSFPYVITYNVGRILSYSLAGALAGGLGAVFTLHIASGIMILKVLSGLFLIAMAAYIGQWWLGLSLLERAGNKLWQYLAPIGKQFLPFHSPLSALPYGIIWGWLPCGLVYSTLTWSLASGSVTQGALVMAAFGLGTLPSIILIALGSRTLSQQLYAPKTKQAIALLLLLAGIYTLFNGLRLFAN